MLRIAVEPWLTLGCLKGRDLRRKSLKSEFLTALLVVCLIALVIIVGDPEPDRLEGRPMVVDGDSLELDGHRIRLVGLDAPEFDQVCHADGQEIACGKQARRALEAIVGGSVVVCEIAGDDRYGRLLARCFQGKRDIGEQLVGAGWAIARYDYLDRQAEARNAGAGLWSIEFVDPAAWREQSDGANDAGGFLSWF